MMQTCQRRIDLAGRDPRWAPRRVVRPFLSGNLPKPHRTLSNRGLKERVNCQAASGDDPLVVLIECDGVFVDLHDNGHRIAFNKAFRSLGLECANWSSQVYYDLRRGGDGTAEGMLTAFFNTVGWPMAVATKEKADFTRQLHHQKQQILKELLQAGEVPLRDGVQDFIDEALDRGAKVGAICGTLSLSEDDVWGSVADSLTPVSARQILPFSWRHQPSGDPNAPETLEGKIQSGIDELKRQEARAFVETVMAKKESGIGVGIDPAILAGRTSGVTAAWMSAVIAMMDGGVSRSVIIGANGPTIKAAASARSLSIAIPAGLSRRGSFPGADAFFENMGRGGGLTWNRIQALMDQKASE
ncbi:hypothetical protein BSKO_08744 [Bryopsis sp. KO-2023]|nr:hypothetical protein BSKO_08744 [Bryopsis sp. KO-2023]